MNSLIMFFKVALKNFCWLSFGGPILGFLIGYMVYRMCLLMRGMDFTVVRFLIGYMVYRMCLLMRGMDFTVVI
jgi:hypothetical protein